MKSTNDKYPLKNHFKHIANENNPLGLVKNNGILFKLIGFFTHMNYDELTCDMRGDLPYSSVAHSFQLFGSNCSSKSEQNVFIPQIRTSTSEANQNFIPAINEQLKHFNLVPKEHFCFDTNFNLIFVFEIYREEVSITEMFTQSAPQAIWDYVFANKEVPEIMSPNRIVEEIARSASGTTKIKNYHKSIVDEKVLKRAFSTYYTKKSIKERQDKERYSKPYKTAEQKQAEIDREIDIVLNSDYDEFSKSLELDLFDIQKRVKQQAKRKGGFVDFVYKNKTYKIPKLPLLAWAYLDSINKAKYTINKETWYPVSPADVKTHADNPYHSDWWIGAGFPISVYELSVGGYNYHSFNKAVTKFAFKMIDKNTLDSVGILAGKELSEIEGNVVVNPQTLDCFNEDDIIVLPKASVEFETFLLKATKNGKGAVIVEVGNKVAHLSIVSREFNRNGGGVRLIILPDAIKLLTSIKKAKISMTEQKIIPIVV